MRGFFFSSLFFISLMLTLVVISQLFGQLEMPVVHAGEPPPFLVPAIDDRHNE